MTDLESAALRLRDAYIGGAIPPLRDVLEPTDASGAYAIQAINTRHWETAGRRKIGHKVGLTAKAVQTQLGVLQPDFGVLFDDMRIENDGRLVTSKVLQPKVEAEVAFVLAADLRDPAVSREEVQAAVGSAMVAIEIVDSRIADWKITFADTVADNGSSAYFVLGTELKQLHGLDLWTCGMVLQINGEVRSLGAGAACLGHPLNAVTWLARTLAHKGETLLKGDIILSGALGPMVALSPGDVVRATVGGVGTTGFTYVKE